MSHTKLLSILITTLLISGFYFLSMSEKAYSGFVPNPVPPCCENPVTDTCFGGENVLSICESQECLDDGCMYYEDRICVLQNEAGVCVAESANVPTMNKWGLIALAGVLAIIGLMAVRRRKVNT